MKTIRLATAVLAASIITGCDAPTAARPGFAYDPTILTNGVVYRWPSGSTVRIFLEPDPGGNGSLDAAVTLAIDAWNRIPEFREFTLEKANSIATANIVIYDRAVANPLSPGSCFFDPRGSGFTYFCLPPGNTGVAERLATASGGESSATVLISVDRGRLSSTAAYESVVAHEIGHAVGIGAHSDEPTDLMFGAPTVKAPSSRDGQTLRYVLGLAADFAGPLGLGKAFSAADAFVVDKILKGWRPNHFVDKNLMPFVDGQDHH